MVNHEPEIDHVESQEGGFRLPDVPKAVTYGSMAMLGMLIVVGGITAMFNGLPWAQRADVESGFSRIQRQLDQNARQNAATIQQVRQLSDTVLTTNDSIKQLSATTQLQINQLISNQNEVKRNYEDLNDQVRDLEGVQPPHHRRHSDGP